jgi:Transglycosylase SLT domain
MFRGAAVEEGTLMTRILMSLLAALAPTPALAGENQQDVVQIAGADRPAEASGTAAMGARISNDVGFQLIEHGHWAPKNRLQLAANSTLNVRSIGVPDPKLRSEKKSSPSRFRRAAFLPHVYAAEARFSLPSGLLDALIWTESRYNPVAVSHAGAAGLGQLMPGTAREMGVVNRFDPRANIGGAARYLRKMLDRFGTVHLALAAYNAGPGAVARVRGIPLNGETPSYVVKVLTRWQSH